ncbi:MAG: hypothetical protein J6J74_07455 [Elusimicrobiaceae bacterium]|nr:hypothetical protein [Elusimicrobiaceae bacterium]
MILGDLLSQAFNIIPTQEFEYCAFTGKTVNTLGVFVNEYAAPVKYFGSIQALEQTQYEKLGLNFEREYRTVYASVQMKGLDKQATPDILIFEGRRWKVIRNTPWFNIDGWCGAVVTPDDENTTAEAENDGQPGNG